MLVRPGQTTCGVQGRPGEDDDVSTGEGWLLQKKEGRKKRSQREAGEEEEGKKMRGVGRGPGPKKREKKN